VSGQSYQNHGAVEQLKRFRLEHAKHPEEDERTREGCDEQDRIHRRSPAWIQTREPFGKKVIPPRKSRETWPKIAKLTHRFGEFELNPGERLLARNGQPVPVAPKAFDALLFLVRNAEHQVSKRDLMDTLWPSTYVTEANLINTFVSLRKVLGQDAIRTVSKHGYRFL
jgi:DNA-binding response OmpR family regulator